MRVSAAGGGGGSGDQNEQALVEGFRAIARQVMDIGVARARCAAASLLRHGHDHHHSFGGASQGEGDHCGTGSRRHSSLSPGGLRRCSASVARLSRSQCAGTSFRWLRRARAEPIGGAEGRDEEGEQRSTEEVKPGDTEEDEMRRALVRQCRGGEAQRRMARQRGAEKMQSDEGALSVYPRLHGRATPVTLYPVRAAKPPRALGPRP